jgi:DNA-directed RNA polymerase I subunit RPA49
MLIYASVMFAFRSAAGRNGNIPERTALLERLAPAPEVVVDGLLARFTETPRGYAKCVGHRLHDCLDAHVGACRARMTSENETSLLTHLFSLCLRVDEYATETALIAADLKMAPTRYDLPLSDLCGYRIG